MHKKYDKKDYIIYNDKDDINTVYRIQTISKNTIFYKCQERPKCQGRGKLNLKNEKFTEISECNFNVKHGRITFEKFKDIYEKKI